MLHCTSLYMGPNWTGILSGYGPSLEHGTSLDRDSPILPSPDMGPHWTGGHHCSNLFTSDTPTGADIWWLLKLVRSAQVGSTHPTEILSCSLYFCKFVLNHRWRTSCLHTVKQNVNVTSLQATSIINSDVCDLGEQLQAGSRLHDISSYMSW